MFIAFLTLAATGLLWSIANLYYSTTRPSPGRGGSYTEGFIGQPAYINPVLAFSENDLALTRLIYSGLYKYDGAGRLVPDLAEAMPQISEDQKQYTVTLRQNAKWHNGKPVKADDVVFTVLTVKDPDFKSPLRGAWASTNIEKVDDFTLKFTTKEVSGPFINNLVLPILPQNLWGQTQAANFPLLELNLKAIGSGPFAVKEIKKLASGKVQSITLESFSQFYSGKPYLDQITAKFYDAPQDLLNALHSREITGFGFMPTDDSFYLDEERENIKVFKLAIPQYQTLFFNNLNKTLADVRIRTALSLLISRNSLFGQTAGGVKPASALSDFYLDKTEAPAPTPDLEKATNLLEAAGWEKNPASGLWEKLGLAMEFSLFTNDLLPNARAAENLAQTFRNFGINITLNILPSKQLSETHIKPRQFDLLLYGQKFGADPDPFAFWHSSQTKDPGLNLSGFEDSEADKLIIEARTSTNQNLRLEKYAQLDELLKNRLPVVFLTQTVYTYALDTNIKGISLSKLYDTAGRFYDAPNWYTREDRVWAR